MTLFSTFHKFSHHVNTYNRIRSRCTPLMCSINEACILNVYRNVYLNDSPNSTTEYVSSFISSIVATISMIPVSHFRNTALRYVTSRGLKVVLDFKASFENGHLRANIEICTQSYEMKLKLVCFHTFPPNLV
jgi:hypothetical protein